MNMVFMRLSVGFLIALSLLPGMAGAGIVSPKDIVENLYAPYLADPHAEQTDGPSALDAIRSKASKTLKHAIHRNDVCERREQGVCNIDFDIIIDAQDWDISHFAVTDGEDQATGLPVVTARFTNGYPREVRYYFISEEGAWKIDDVQASQHDKRGKITRFYQLKSELSKLF